MSILTNPCKKFNPYVLTALINISIYISIYIYVDKNNMDLNFCSKEYVSFVTYKFSFKSL